MCGRVVQIKLFKYKLDGKSVMKSKPHCCLSVLLVFSVSACSQSDKGDVSLPSSPVKSIELDVIGIGYADPQTVKFTTEAEIKPIMAVLQSGRTNEDHKCPSVGHFRILHADSSTTEIGILPGHSEEYYEFRYKGTNYCVLRKDFLAAVSNKEFDKDRLFEMP